MQSERTIRLHVHGRWMRRVLASLGLALAALTAGCATTQQIPELQQAESQYQQAQNKDRIQEFASHSMQQAQQSLQKAKSLSDNGGDRDAIKHYAFMTERYVEIADARLQRGLAREQIKTADQRRQSLLLAAEKRESARHESKAKQAEQKLAQTRQQLEQTQQAADQLAQQVKELKVKQDKRGTVFTLSDVVFDFDSAQLNEGGRRSVRRIADTLKNNPAGEIVIQGYTDSVGSAAYNKDLSKRRAEAVKQVFVDNGVDPDRLRVEGYGEQYPVASNDTPQGRQLNRRVEIVVAPKGQSTQPSESERTASAG